MFVVREKQHLRLRAQLTEHLKRCHGAIVVELNQKIIKFASASIHSDVALDDSAGTLASRRTP